MIKTVLGKVDESEIKAVLCHEHICCYSEYLHNMTLTKNFNKEDLIIAAVNELKNLKDKYNMNLFVDCTPVNIGRNVQLLKEVSTKSGVHIVCSTGFYYTEEVLLYNASVETLTEICLNDAKIINAGVIKAAVEHENLSEFNEKLLIVSANVQKRTGLPIVLHTNAKNKNGLKALQILLERGVQPSSVTIGHLSDTEDIDYIKKFAEYGCYIGLDRLHNDTSEDYISKKLNTINKLIDAGFLDRIILSQDELMYSEFSSVPRINDNPRYKYVFDNILSRLENRVAETIIQKNPIRMLKCQ